MEMAAFDFGELHGERVGGVEPAGTDGYADDADGSEHDSRRCGRALARDSDHKPQSCCRHRCVDSREEAPDHAVGATAATNALCGWQVIPVVNRLRAG